MKKHRQYSIEQLETRSCPTADPTALATAFASAFYSYNGTGNNLAHPTWGSAGTQLLRIAAAAYEDGRSAPAGSDRPSAREISNTIVDQGGEDIISDRFLSAMVYVWGQFIDHDLDLTPNANPAEPFNVTVPQGDTYFTPGGSIFLNRSLYDPTTGKTTPREQINVITSWLDGSMIYGSDAATAAALRTFRGGKLKTSPGGLLPLNNSTYFPNGTLNMANDAHLVPNDQLYAAGDVRANENIELTALHTLFVREHNFWAGVISSRNRGLRDEQVYQQARAMVIAEIQAITFNQWLPAVLGWGAVDRYQGYDPTVNPGIANEFSTAGFRVGHTLLGDDVEFLGDDGVPVGEEVPLSGAFFNPELVDQFGIDPILKYLASDPASEIDSTIVGSVRNFLFGPPGAGGFDLASLNIQRGREHGLPDYNSVRAAYGLPKVTDFDQITSNTDVQAKLEQLYGSVDNIDLWVGALAEDHVRGSSVGTTLRAIISDQFERLRDGDRLWFENTMSGRTLQQIESTTLTDIMRRNTDLSNLQPNAFFFFSSLSGTVFADLNGDGRISRGERNLPGRTVQLVNVEEGEVVATTTTDSRGFYRFNVADGLRTGQYEIRIVLRPDVTQTISRTVSVTRGGQVLNNLNLGILRSQLGLLAPIGSLSTAVSQDLGV